MTQQHTPEPRNTFRDGTTFIVMSAQGDAVIAGDAAIEDARRIVACVNACKGIPTETLEANGQIKDWEVQAPPAIVEQMAAALEQARHAWVSDSPEQVAAFNTVVAALAAYRTKKGGGA